MIPTQNDVHTNVPLTNVSLAYMQDPEDFVAGKVFPVVPVQKQSDKYPIYDFGDFNRDTMEKRADAAETQGSGYRLSSDTYDCDVWGLHKDIGAQVRANADSVFNMDRDATAYLAQQALISREINWAANFFAASKWTTDVTGVASGPTGAQVLQWNDAASTPIEDIRGYKRTSQLLTARKPNKLVLGPQVWDALQDHPDIIDRIKGDAGPSSPAKVTKAVIAALLELDEILVMDSIKNTANEGADAVGAFIGGKGALLAYAAARPSLLEPSGGYTFAWAGYLGSSSPQRIKRFYMEKEDADRVEIEATYDQKLTAADCGVFFATVVA